MKTLEAAACYTTALMFHSTSLPLTKSGNTTGLFFALQVYNDGSRNLQRPEIFCPQPESIRNTKAESKIVPVISRLICKTT